MNVADTLRAHLGIGDLTSILCDRGAALPLPGPWPHRFGTEAFAGAVRTARSPSGELAAVDRALDGLAPEEVLLIDSGSDAAIWGGRLTGRALRAGAAGVVVAGNVRDVPSLREGRLPLVARGVAPHRSDASGPGDVDAPLRLGDATIRRGDVLIADANGVVVVPQDGWERVRAEFTSWLHQERAKE